MTWAESQAHVALWAITSSPLFLANDVREGHMQQRLVDMMTNRAMIAVNQNYSSDAGFSGDRIWSNATGKELCKCSRSLCVLFRGRLMTRLHRGEAPARRRRRRRPLQPQRIHARLRQPRQAND